MMLFHCLRVSAMGKNVWLRSNRQCSTVQVSATCAVHKPQDLHLIGIVEVMLFGLALNRLEDSLLQYVYITRMAADDLLQIQ